jgi:hypothetical protein
MSRQLIVTWVTPAGLVTVVLPRRSGRKQGGRAGGRCACREERGGGERDGRQTPNRSEPDCAACRLPLHRLPIKLKGVLRSRVPIAAPVATGGFALSRSCRHHNWHGWLSERCLLRNDSGL